MDSKYKICFLGYGKLSELARNVINKLNYPDTTVILKDCAIDTLKQTVLDCSTEGIQVFVAGSANAEEFKRNFSEHLIELQIDMSDYLFCIRQAQELDAHRIAVTIHRKSQQMDLDLLQQLTNMPIVPIYYESEAELEYHMLRMNCDCIIGAALACELANKLGIKSILIYEGEYAIHHSIDRARNLAAELQSATRKEVITNSILRNSPTGIIVTDADDRITSFNPQAKKMTGFQDQRLRGKILSELIPQLSYEVLAKSGLEQFEHRHLLNGTMIRCIQTQLMQGDQRIGVLTTLQIDNSHKKKSDPAQSYTAQHRWKDLIGNSLIMKSVISECKALEQTDANITIIGASGTGKNAVAQCIHNGSQRSAEPYIIINAAILGNNAPDALMGNDSEVNRHVGFFELAGNGTIVLEGLANASQSFYACLQQVLIHHSFFSTNGTVLKQFNARIITLLDPDDYASLPYTIKELLSPFTIKLPLLRERNEDIPELFRFFLARESNLKIPVRQADFDELLCFYSWPSNLLSLYSVCKRYAFWQQQTMNNSQNARQQTLIHAIGEDELLSDIFLHYPSLKHAADCSQAELNDGIAAMKKYLKYNNSVVADKLGLGRTTLWRMTRDKETLRQ